MHPQTAAWLEDLDFTDNDEVSYNTWFAQGMCTRQRDPLCVHLLY